MYASKYPCMYMFSNETQHTRYIMAPPTEKNIWFCPLVFQGGLPVVPPVPRTVQDLGDE